MLQKYLNKMDEIKELMLEALEAIQAVINETDGVYRLKGDPDPWDWFEDELSLLEDAIKAAKEEP